MEASSAVFNWPSRSTASRLVVPAVTAACVGAKAIFAPISQPTGFAAQPHDTPAGTAPRRGAKKGPTHVGPLVSPPENRGRAKTAALRGISVGACHIKQPANADG